MSKVPNSQPAVKNIRAQVAYWGHVEGRGRFDVHEPERTNVDFETHEMLISDIRGLSQPPSLEDNGFTVVKHRSVHALDPELFEANMQRGGPDSEPAINALYLNELAAMLQDLTGAREVFPVANALLVRTSDRSEKKSWAGPAGFVHLDYAPSFERDFLHQSLALSNIELRPYRKMLVLQTWRVLVPPPQDSTLAFCDGSSVSPADGLVMDSVIGPPEVPGNSFETRVCCHNANHRWFYLSDMQPDDLLVFKGYDSQCPEAMNAMHTGINMPGDPETLIPRRSVEARFFAFFD